MKPTDGRPSMPTWTTDDSGFLSHPLLRNGRVQYRQFQTEIASESLKANTLVVIPTGLGKTVIAVLAIAARLDQVGGRALLLAPSRPLADQHAKTLTSLLNLGSAACLTGTDAQRKRAGRWGSRRLLSATPQVALNDLRKGLLPRDFSVVVFDEAHRAVGAYAYVPLARELRALCPSALFLGLTASPGHEVEHIEEVCANLFIQKVELRSREDPDLAPYVQGMEIRWIEVQPSEVIKKVSGYMTKYSYQRFNQIRKYGFLRNRKNVQVRIQDLNEVHGQVLARRRSDKNPWLFQVSRQISLARMGQHALLTVERQGVDSFLKFVEPKLKPGRSKVDASFVKDPLVQRAYKAAKRWKGPSHPKLEPLLRVVSQQIKAKPRSEVIVFAELRDTVDFLVTLFRSRGMKVERFTGQGSRQGRKGLTQKQQRDTLSRFGSGSFQVMCATSVAEEGLDIPQVDLVVFYEPVASEVRLIQRKGRTGRDAPGKVIILTTDKTADEAYLWAGLKREKRMRRLVKRMGEEISEGGGTLHRSKAEEVDTPAVDTKSEPGRKQRRLVDY